jgi:hypothetical protein
MYGQAPYIVNALITYDLTRIGFSASMSYNVQGPRLSIVSNPPTPNIFELPRHIFDLKISKTIGERFGMSFKIRNILNAPTIRAYEYNDWEIIYDEYRFGTEYGISFSYNFQ